LSAYCFFFFQAEDGIRDFHVTGVQTCALPIYAEIVDQAILIQHLAEGQHIAGLYSLAVMLFACDPQPDDEIRRGTGTDGFGNLRSEERRVGKECRSRWGAEREKKKQRGATCVR